MRVKTLSKNNLINFEISNEPKQKYQKGDPINPKNRYTISGYFRGRRAADFFFEK